MPSYGKTEDDLDEIFNPKYEVIRDTDITLWVIDKAEKTVTERSIHAVMYLLKNKLNELGFDVYEYKFEDSWLTGPYDKILQDNVEAQIVIGAVSSKETRIDNIEGAVLAN